MTSSSSLYGTVTQQNTSSANSTGLYGDANTPIPDASGNLVVRGDLYVLSGNILTTANTGNLFPTNATTVNVGLAATAVNIGSATGDTTVNNNLVVEGNLTTNGTFIAPSADFGNIQIAVVDGQTISTSAGELRLRSTSNAIKLPSVTSIYTDNTGSFGLLNQPTTVNAFLAATTLNIGASSGTTNINNNLLTEGTGTFTGDITAPGGTLGNISVGVINNNTIDNATGAITISSGANSIVLDSEYISNPNANAYLFNSPTTVIAFDSATTLNLGDVTGTTFIRNDVTVGGDLKINGNDIKSNGGTTAITLSGNDVTIADDLTINGNNLNLAQDTLIGYSENNDRLNRPTVRSTTGNTSGFRVEAPNTSTTAAAIISASNSSDPLNSKFININARGSAITNDLRIQTGKYTAGVLGASGSVVSFVDNVTTYATVNPAGPTNPLDLATKAYVDAQELNTTYTIDATATTGGANFNLVGSDSTTDTIKFAQGTGITVSRTDANTITITNTAPDTNTTYTQNISATTGGANLNLVGSDSTVDTVKFADGTGVTVSYTDASTATIAIGQAVGTSDNVQFNGVTTNSVTTGTVNANGGVSFVNTAPMGGTYATVNQFGPAVGTDLTTVDYVNSVLPTVVTYTQDASATTGGANLNLVGSDATTDTVKFSGSGATTVSQTNANEINISSVDTNTTYDFNATSTTGGANLNLVGSDSTTDTVKLTNGGGITATYTSGTEVTLGSTATSANTPSAIVARDGSGNFAASGATLGNVTVGVDTDQVVSTTSGDLVLQTAAGVNAGTVTLAAGANGNITLAPNGTGVVASGVTTMSDSSRVFGQLIATRNTTYTPPGSSLTTVTGSNGIVVSSSTGGANGYAPTVGIRYHTGDTTAAGNTAASLAFSAATGTSATPGGGFSANLVLGTINWDGYTSGASNNYASQIATANQGAGTTALQPIQAQAYARQTFTNSTTVTTAVTGASGTGSVATLTFTTQNTAPYAVGQSVTVAGMTPSGYNGTYTITAATTSSISYANATTGFTTGGTIGAANTVTAAGAGFRVRGFANSTNMSAANRFNFMDLTASAATFKSNAYTFANEVITGSTLTATNYMTLGATTGSINQDTLTVKNTAGTTTYATFASTGTTISGAGLSQITRTTVGTPGSPEARPSFNIQLTRSDQATPNNNDGTGFRSRVAGSNGTNYTLTDLSSAYSTTGDVAWFLNLANGDQTGATFSSLPIISASISSTTIKAGTPSATPGASTASDVVKFDPSKITAFVPIAFPVYTAVALRAITGSVGWQACVSNSASGGNPNGMMAFWDTTNARWSYIHDNSAV